MSDHNTRFTTARTKTNHCGFAALVDTARDPLVLIDKNYQIIAANAAYTDIHGISSEQVIGRTCYQVSHGRNRPCHEFGDDCPHQQVFKQHRCHEVQHQHCDGHGGYERVRIHGQIIPLDNGEYLLAERVTKVDTQNEPTNIDSALQSDQPPQTSSEWIPSLSPRSQKVFHQLDMAARSDAPILLLGESGVGKEMAACYVHRHSQRHRAQMVTIDCTTLTESLFEAELFGHEAGAYTGANHQIQGLIEQAQGGTLFLDEIGELSMPMQAKLLRLLEQRRIRRVGGRRDIEVDFRVIAATNRDLEESVEQGQFRADLYYRLACISMTIPCLRDRTEDILPLAQYFIEQINKKSGRQCCLSANAIEKLQQHDFPGNIRELKNRVQRAITLAETTHIEPHHLGFETQILPNNKAPSMGSARQPQEPPQDEYTPTSLAEQEHLLINRLLKAFSGHRRKVAEALGISERTLYRKLKKHKAT